MRKSFFFTVAGIFITVSTLHFLRLAFELDIYIGSWSIPGWFSGMIVVFAAFMAYWSLKINRRNNQVEKEKNKE